MVLLEEVESAPRKSMLRKITGEGKPLTRIFTPGVRRAGSTGFSSGAAAGPRSCCESESV